MVKKFRVFENSRIKLNGARRPAMMPSFIVFHPL
jgi:hypothetical protein